MDWMTIFNPQEAPFWLLGVILAVAACAVWMAGTRLSTYADLLSERTGVGEALLGLLLLATATSLPEVATTATAGVMGNAPLMVGNLIGGVAMQTAILAGVDLVLVRRAPLTFFAPSTVLLIQGVLLVAMQAITLTALAGGLQWSVLNVGIWPMVLFVLFVLMLWNTRIEEGRARWEAVDVPPEADKTALRREAQQRYANVSTPSLGLRFCLGAILICIAGVAITVSADEVAVRTGLGSTLVGAVLVAITTSLPEISTVTRSIRLGAFSMAISNIFGSNALCLALLLVGDITYRSGPVLGSAGPSAAMLAGVGTLMTLAYLWGMIERRDKTILGMGIASSVTLGLYAIALVMLWMLR